jgi:hypothetical protein
MRQWICRFSLCTTASSETYVQRRVGPPFLDFFDLAPFRLLKSYNVMEKFRMPTFFAFPSFRLFLTPSKTDRGQKLCSATITVQYV